MNVHVISRKKLSDYWFRVPETEQSLKAWFAEAKSASWKTPQDIKEKYRSASFLKNNRVVFNICGRHSLFLKINFEGQVLRIELIKESKNE